MRLRGTGGVFKKKGSRFLYVSWYDPVTRKQIQESTKSESRSVAEGVLRERLTESGKGLPVAESLKLKYEDIREGLFSDYRIHNVGLLKTDEEGEETISGIHHLDSFFKGRLVKNIAAPLIRKYIEVRQNEGAANATINRSTSLLRRMMAIAFDDDRLGRIPNVPRLPEADPRQGFLEPRVYARLLAALPEHLRPLITFLYYTGCRIGAAKQIKWNQISFSGERAELMLRPSQTKSGEALMLMLPKEVDAVLKGMERQDPVFDATNLRKSWMNACVACGLGTQNKHRYRGLIVHDLRRSGVRNLIRSGVDESVAMKISGHKTNAVFKRYNITSTKDVRRAMESVERYNETSMKVPDEGEEE